MASGVYRNAAREIPVSSGLVLLFDGATGYPLAVLAGNAYLREVRTALAGAIAAKHLANPEIDTVGVLGAGSQARYQVWAPRLARVRSVSRIAACVPRDDRKRCSWRSLLSVFVQ